MGGQCDPLNLPRLRLWSHTSLWFPARKRLSAEPDSMWSFGQLWNGETFEAVGICFYAFAMVFSVISQENVCIQSSKLHGVLKCLLMRITQDTQRFFFKVSWCPTASLQWNSLTRSPSVFVGGYFHKTNSKVGVMTRILYDFVGAIDCTIPSLFLGVFFAYTLDCPNCCVTIWTTRFPVGREMLNSFVNMFPAKYYGI